MTDASIVPPRVEHMPPAAVALAVLLLGAAGCASKQPYSPPLFARVVAVLPFEDEADAIRLANDTIYGLASAIFTADINKAFKFAKGLRAGSVWVNTYDGGDITTPFGGYKQSGNGRDKSLHAFDKFTQIKTTWIQLG